MAGCEINSPGANENWGIQRVLLGWGGTGTTLGAAAALTWAKLGGLVLSTGQIAWIVLLAAAAGYVIFVGVGNAIFWFTRLEEHKQSPLTIAGTVACAGKNTGLPPFNDNDWTFNFTALRITTVPGPTVEQLQTEPASSGGAAFASFNDPSTKCAESRGNESVLHCEIGSAVGDAATIGQAVGAVGGAIAGGIIAAALGCVVAGIFTFGIGCLIAILVGILIGAVAGSVVGDLAGAGIGWIIDQASDFDRRGEAIECGCSLFISGPWVTDTGHQHNEIHDIRSAVLIDCGVGGTGSPLEVAGAVGIGRHPQGRDP